MVLPMKGGKPYVAEDGLPNPLLSTLNAIKYLSSRDADDKDARWNAQALSQFQPGATRVLLLLAWVCVVLSPVPRRRAIGLPSGTVGATRVLVLLAWVCVVLSSAAAGGSPS